MNLPPAQQKKLLVALLAVLGALIVYRALSAEKPRTAPLAFPRGSVAASVVRTGIHSAIASGDPLQLLLAQREEKFPGVVRDIFRMQNPAPPRPKPVVKTEPTPTVPPPPVVPVRTPEEIAADAARADLAKFRFLGYLTDRDSSLFLSKNGELFIVRSGDSVLRNYRVKEAGRDYVVLLDVNTNVERRVELSGGEQASPHRPRY